MRKVERSSKRAKRRGKADWDGQDDVIGSLDYGETSKPALPVPAQSAVPSSVASTSAAPAKAEHSHSRSSRKQPPVGSAPPFALRDVPLFNDPAPQPSGSPATPPAPLSSSASPAPTPAGSDGPPARKETRGERKDREAREVQARRAAMKAAKEAEAAAAAAANGAGGVAEAAPVASTSTAPPTPAVDVSNLPVDSRARSRATKPAGAASPTVAPQPTPTIVASTKPSPSPSSGSRPLPAPYGDPVTASPALRGPPPPLGKVDGDFGYVAVSATADGAANAPFAVNGNGKAGKKGKALKSKALGKLSPRMPGAVLPPRHAPPGAYDPQNAAHGPYPGGPPPAHGYDPRYPAPPAPALPLPGPGYGYGPGVAEGYHHPYGPPPVGDPYGYERGYAPQPSYPPQDAYYPPPPGPGYDPHYPPPPPPQGYPPHPPPQQHDAHGRWPGQPNYGKR